MKNLLAIPFSEYSSSGVNYSIVDMNGTIFLRCIVTTRNYADHDLNIKELAEAPSNVRVEVKTHFDNLFGKNEWKVVTRMPFNSLLLLEGRIETSIHEQAVELQFNPQLNEVKKHQISN